MRTIEWPGAYNIRDLGGLPLPGGAQTAFGRVLRSGRVEYLTDDGWHAAIDAGLSTIIDLRNPEERKRRSSDPKVDEALMATIERIGCPVEDPDNAEFVQAQDEVGYDHPRAYRFHLDFLPDHTVAVFRSLARVERPVLVHCQQGRDRTGFVTSLLLALNGVPLDAIGDDFALGVQAANDDLITNPGHSSESPLDGPALHAYIEERRSALIEWLATVDIAAYLADAGMPTDELAVASTLLHP